MKKNKKILSIAIVIFVILLIMSFLYADYANSANYTYREIIREMKNVHNGDKITNIKFLIRGGLLIHIDIKPDMLSKEDAYELGLDCQKIIDKQSSENPNEKIIPYYLVYLTINPVPDQPSATGYGFTRLYDKEKDMYEWYFEGKIAN